jgi:hypothetical protein
MEGTTVIIPTPPCPDCPGEGEGRQGIAQLVAQGGFIDPRILAPRTYPAVFFPATTDRASAASIQVTAGQQLAGIDVALIAR